MWNVVIVAGCRTPIGTINGQFKTLTALDLSIPVMQGLVARSGIDPNLIEDVIWGCNYQRTYLENNLARVAAVKAGLPDTVPGITIHRNCTSSMSSIQMGFYQIMAGEALAQAHASKTHARYSEGVSPVSFLKAVQKLLSLVKPRVMCIMRKLPRKALRRQ